MQDLSVFFGAPRLQSSLERTSTQMISLAMIRNPVVDRALRDTDEREEHGECLAPSAPLAFFGVFSCRGAVVQHLLQLSPIPRGLLQSCCEELICRRHHDNVLATLSSAPSCTRVWYNITVTPGIISMCGSPHTSIDTAFITELCTSPSSVRTLA